MIWILVSGVIILLFGFVVFFGAPYVPSQRKYVRRAFEQLYQLGPKDVLVDIGSGDGLILRLAAEKGATAIGYELNPVLVCISRLLSAGTPNITTELANFWHVKLPQKTTIIYVFTVSRDSKKLARTLQSEATRLKKTLSVIAYGTPLKGIQIEKDFEAYHLYRFHPLQPQKAQV